MKNRESIEILSVRERLAKRNVRGSFEWSTRQRCYYGSRYSEAVWRRTALFIVFFCLFAAFGVKLPANAANETSAVQIQPIKNERRQVSMVVTEVGRNNPFEPVFGGYDEDTDYYLAAPPEVPGLDNDALDVIKARVAGIIYDRNNVNSSAIVNIGGADYLTRIGDKINGYVVTAIDKNDITVQLGSNTFKAGVGDIISSEDLYDVNKTKTPALETKFAGRRK